MLEWPCPKSGWRIKGKQALRVFSIKNLSRAGNNDVVELMPVRGQTPLYMVRWILDVLVFGIVHHETIHLSGPTGSAKSSLIEAVCLVPENFTAICKGLGLGLMPIKLYPVEMAIYETPGELYVRRALRDGNTYDEKSKLLTALEEASKLSEECYPVVWLREMGRVHSSSVLGGLLNLMTKGRVALPDGSHFDGSQVAWIADSNYQAENDSTHMLVTLDDSLKSRFSLNLTLDYFSPQHERKILRCLAAEQI
jgi:hypothetical protein